MAKNYMQFETRGLGEHARPGTDVKIAFCVTPSVTFADKMKTVVIDNELADIDRDIIQRLAETIKAADIKASARQRVDCNAFTVMMAGGIYPGTEKSAYVSGRHGRKIVYGEPFPIDEPREIEPMQPVLMGTLTHTPLLPAHMTLRLPSDKPLWVQKLGDLPVGIASIETVATHYGSTHASEVYQVVFGTPDELILGYKQDEQPPQPHNIYIGG